MPVPCCVPWCPNVKARRDYEGEEWVCRDHGREVPERLKRLRAASYARLRDIVACGERRTPAANEIGYRVAGAWRVFDPETASAYVQAKSLEARFWSRIKSFAIERAAGIA